MDIKSALCTWGFNTPRVGSSFSSSKFFTLNSSHQSAGSVTHTLLLEYTAHVNFLRTGSSSSGRLSTVPNIWKAFTISLLGESCRNVVIQAFFETLKNLPPQSAPVKLWSPIKALNCSFPSALHLSLMSIVQKNFPLPVSNFSCPGIVLFAQTSIMSRNTSVSGDQTYTSRVPILCVITSRICSGIWVSASSWLWLCMFWAIMPVLFVYAEVP